MKLLFFYFIAVLFFNYLLKKYKILNSYSGSIHQKFTNDSVTLSGGIFIFIPFIYSFIFEYSLIFTFCASLIFILGLLSDLKHLNNPKLRLFIQFIILVFFVFSLKIEVLPTRIDFIDNNFQNTFSSYFFTVFCLLILLNGSNFIDGLNGLLLGYFILILFFLFKLEILILTDTNFVNIYYFIFLLLFLLILNYFNFLFLGDNGSYLLSFIIGYLLIIIYNNSTHLSPYFIILLLWYPCFENLFSIIRKKIYKNDPLKADNYHLHHYLYKYVKNKFEVSKLFANNLTSIIVNLFNFIIFYIGSEYKNLTYVQLSLIIFCILIYFSTYFFLKNILKNK